MQQYCLKLFSYLSAITLGLLFVPVKTALALDLDVRSDKSSRLDFSLVIDNAVVEVEENSSSAELDLLRIGIVSVELPRHGPQFGLLLGYAYLDVSSDSNYETLDMDGYYIGVSMRAYLLRQQSLSLSFYTHYIYQSVDNEKDQAKASLRWDEISAELVVAYRFNAIGVLYAGVNGGSIDSRYRYNGTSNVVVDQENSNQSGGMVGFNYQINPLETVGIRYQQSVMEGVQLQFRKIF